MINESLQKFIEKVKIDIFEAQKCCFIVRDKKFHKKAITDLTQLKKEATLLKTEFISKSDEESSNCLLSIELMLNTLIEELSMWLAFKEENPDKAWNCLVNAQISLRNSYQASELPEFNWEGYTQKLYLIEKLLFPKFIFTSPAMVVEKSSCTICGKEYGSCEHIKGRAYMGEMCYRRIDKIKDIREISFVEEPANKHARVINIPDGNIERNFLTWKEINKKHKEDKN